MYTIISDVTVMNAYVYTFWCETLDLLCTYVQMYYVAPRSFILLRQYQHELWLRREMLAQIEFRKKRQQEEKAAAEKEEREVKYVCWGSLKKIVEELCVQT